MQVSRVVKHVLISPESAIATWCSFNWHFNVVVWFFDHHYISMTNQHMSIKRTLALFCIWLLLLYPFKFVVRMGSYSEKNYPGTVLLIVKANKKARWTPFLERKPQAGYKCICSWQICFSQEIPVLAIICATSDRQIYHVDSTNLLNRHSIL